ncbi:MAG: tyrosine-type recombinase/integrase [Brevundimonas sp.]|nr:tyrosine-type recombinase/integrase [Brevundimonas sp.]
MAITSRKKITKRVVDATDKHKTEDVIVWDTDISGFRLRVRPSGRKVYELRYRPKGSTTQRQVTIGRHGSPWTAESARENAKAKLAAAEEGKDPLDERHEQRTALTVAEMADAYLLQGPAHKPNKRASSWAIDRYSFDHHLKPLLGKRKARSLTAADLAGWQSKVATGATAKREPSGKPRGMINVRGGPGAAARAMRSVAAMLAWAKSQRLVDHNPAEGVEKIPDGTRERYLSDEEGAAIWQAIDTLSELGQLTPDQVSYFRLLMLTGARRGEILGLKWSEVDLRRGLLLLAPLRHKSGGRARPKSLHLSPAAIDILTRMKGRHPGFIHLFPALQAQAKAGNRDGEKRPAIYSDTPMSPPKSAWARVLKQAGVADASFHTLRHTFASQVIADGTGLYTLSRMLGHARASTTERYAHLRLDAGATAAEGVAERYRSSDPPLAKVAE